MALCPGLPGWAGTRKVKPIWILLKQETVSGIGISWAICKSASRSRQITTPAPHHSFFYRPDALPAAQPIASKHWRHKLLLYKRVKFAAFRGKAQEFTVVSKLCEFCESRDAPKNLEPYLCAVKKLLTHSLIDRKCLTVSGCSLSCWLSNWGVIWWIKRRWRKCLVG